MVATRRGSAPQHSRGPEGGRSSSPLSSTALFVLLWRTITDPAVVMSCANSSKSLMHFIKQQTFSSYFWCTLVGVQSYSCLRLQLQLLPMFQISALFVLLWRTITDPTVVMSCPEHPFSPQIH